MNFRKVVILATILQTLIWVGLGYFAYKGFTYVEQEGLKPIAERVWQGKGGNK